MQANSSVSWIADNGDEVRAAVIALEGAARFGTRADPAVLDEARDLMRRLVTIAARLRGAR